MKINWKDIIIIAEIFILMLVIEALILIINAFITPIVPGVGNSLVPMVVLLMVLVSILMWKVFFKKD